MRRIVAVFAALLSAVALSGLAAESVVKLETPRITTLPWQALQKACHAGKSVNACTHIDATLLTSCVAAESLFHMSAAVRITPLVFTVSHTMLHHEMAHVSDFVTLLNAYGRNLATPVYESREACEASARVAQMTFGQRLRSFQGTSAMRQDRAHVPAAIAVAAISSADRGD